jgi:positive regulator of sigma E activity
MPWLESSIFVNWTYTFLLVLLFVIVGYSLVKNYIRRKEIRLVLIILASVIIFLPASSAMGTLRLYYVVPFGLMLIATILDDALDLRLPLLLAAILVIIGNGISMARFTRGVESFHYYYFDLNPTTYYLIGQTSTILMVVSFFAVLYPDLQSERRKLGKS